MRFGAFAPVVLFATAMIASSCGNVLDRSELKSSSDSQAAGKVQLTNTFHDDGRARLVFDPEWKAPALKGGDLAKSYLTENAAALGLQADGSGLVLRDVRQSLLGTHYTWQQVSSDNLEIFGSSIIVSVNRDETKVYMVYNTTLPTTKMPQGGVAKSTLISDEAAEEIAWQGLRVQGKLQDDPRVTTGYQVINGQPVLVKKVYFDISTPLGAWETTVDAISGKVLDRIDTAVYKKAPDAISWKNLKSARDRQLAYAEYYTRRNAARMSEKQGSKEMAVGTALMFDPEPRGYLALAALTDTSPANMFDPAYLERTLRDITKVGADYTLKGPYVQIIDFESPSTAPSKTTDGVWRAKRGNNAFNDVVTYFHVDQNQRYLQSLGFVGATAIQARSIEIDSDGVNGDDNSHFIPSSNRIAYGHGCVDDNEDPDVILHEYGHAITFGITPSWGGGDTGAIGEGFGDYWGATYSYSVPQARNFEPFHAFTWDGVSACWPGRRLDAFATRYDPTKTYGAHQNIGGGFQSDELWGTPIVQALWTLMGQGVPREEVDRIIIQSFFGLGGGVKMREMAAATINAARSLYPNGPHARVFQEKFAAHEIVLMPRPKLAAGAAQLAGTGANGAADPGETITINVPLSNTGDLAATSVVTKLVSADAQVVVLDADSTYANLAVGAANVLGATPFTVKIDPAVPCGKVINLTLKITTAELSETTVAIKIPTGVSIGSVNQSVTPNVAIPDNSAAGVTSEVTITATGVIVTADFSVPVEIRHPYIGDLKVKLVSPAGTTIILKAKGAGSSADDIVGEYPGTLTPTEALTKLYGEPVTGTWKLIVADSASSDAGSLVSWGIKSAGPVQCE